MKTTAKIILYFVIIMFLLSLSSVLFAQGLMDLKGVQLHDGTVIHGKVIELNINQVIIEKKDGNRVSIKFDDVSTFLTDETPGITASPAHSSNGLYISANFGLAILKDADIQNFSPTITFKSDPGFALGAAVGYSFNYGRVEAEIAYQKNDMDKGGIAGLGEVVISGNSSSRALLLNGYFDFKNTTAFTPYFSAGIGVAKVEISAINVPGYGAFTTKSYDDTVFAYQVGAGVGFAATEKVTIDLKYRYFGTSDPEFNDVKSNYGSHNIYLGVRYTF